MNTSFPPPVLPRGTSKANTGLVVLLYIGLPSWALQSYFSSWTVCIGHFSSWTLCILTISFRRFQAPSTRGENTWKINGRHEHEQEQESNLINNATLLFMWQLSFPKCTYSPVEVLASEVFTKYPEHIARVKNQLVTCVDFLAEVLTSSVCTHWRAFLICYTSSPISEGICFIRRGTTHFLAKTRPFLPLFDTPNIA